jgi:leukotriene-A4 hydrolase
MKLGKDPHSYANFEEAVTRNIKINVNIDFDRKIIFGSVVLSFEILKENVENILLDAKGLAIESTIDHDTNNSLLFTIPKNSNIGFCLQVPIPKKKVGEIFNLRVGFNTTEFSGGIQWFEPEQTAGKKYPFMYSQFEGKIKNV